MRRRRRGMGRLGKWLPGQARWRSTLEDRFLPMSVDVDCPGLGVHADPNGDGWVVTHTVTGMAIMQRLSSEREARRVATALCRGIEQRCGFTWGDIRDDHDREKVGCIYPLVVEARKYAKQAKPRKGYLR